MLKRLLAPLLALLLLLPISGLFSVALADDDDSAFTLIEGIWLSPLETHGNLRVRTLVIAGDGTYVYNHSDRDLTLPAGYSYNDYGALHPVTTAGDYFLFIGDRRSESLVEGVSVAYDPATDLLYYLGITFSRGE